MIEGVGDNEMDVFIKTLKQVSEYNLENYSRNPLKRRLVKILEDYKTDIAHLNKDIIKNKCFRENIIRDITINITYFFRDPEAWVQVGDVLSTQFREKKPMHIWHAGCSTGQEVYSMVILLLSYHLLEQTRIFCTDIDMEVLKIAEKGAYKYTENQEHILQFLETVKNPDIAKTADRMMHIDKKKNILQIPASSKKNIKFQKHSLVTGTNPFEKKFDMIVCRNVMIYFNKKIQTRLIHFFYQQLNPKGVLILGAQEPILGEYAHLFVKKKYIYQKVSED